MGAGSSTNKRGKDQTSPGLDAMNVSSGFRSDKIEFTWKIENFDVVRQSKEQICAQKFEFNVGEKIGLPCKMACCLHYAEPNPADNNLTDDESSKKWIGLYYNLVQTEAPESAPHVNTQMQIEIPNKHGQTFLKLDGGVADLVTKQGWGFPEVLSKDASVDQFPLIEGNLVIRIKLTIFAPNQSAITQAATTNLLRLHKRNSTRGISKTVYNLIHDYNKLLTQENDAEEGTGFADVKLQSNDNKVFRAHRAILSVRSPVFEAMFRHNMCEAQTGVVNIPDISSPALKVLLRFIYTGTLTPHDWSKADVIVELTNAAAKYELKDLLEFLDGKLGSVCDEQTAGKLLLLASRLKLCKAEKQILEYIKRHGISKSKDFISIVKHIAAENEN